jgi:glycosyltransferase involved in cell wall biosynthesis
MIKVGVITATYDRPELLIRLHTSIAEQGNLTKWCHYIVDDGSKSDYSSAFRAIKRLSGNLRTKRIPNSGVLVARNHAMEMAISDGCTHLCFVDDDDFLLPNSISTLMGRLELFDEHTWFVFRSKKADPSLVAWPEEPIEMSWFDDIILKKRLGSDNLVVVATKLVGDLRFSECGRNQREWKFFLKLCRKNDRILVLPQTLREIDYQDDGLTAQTHRRPYKPVQILNSIDRAIQYWLVRPKSPKLLLQVARQLSAAPVKLLLFSLSNK